MKTNGCGIATKACLVLALACGTASAEIKVKDGEKIAFLGDSITWVGSFKDGYCQLTMRALERLGLKDVKSVHCGVSGDTSRGMLKRLPDILAKEKPDWITISCGVNDAGLRNWSSGVGGVDTPEFKDNVVKMFDLCDKAGTKVVVVTPSCRGEALGQVHLTEYAEFMAAEGRKRGYPVADVYKATCAIVADKSVPTVLPTSPWKLTYDGTHSTYQGDVVFSKTILEALGVSPSEFPALEKMWWENAGSPHQCNGAYVVDPSCIRTEKGYPFRSNYYVGGRMTARYGDFTGLQEVMWFGPKAPITRVFRADDNNNYFQCFRLDVLIDGKAYRPEFTKTVQYPFGYSSECILDGVQLVHQFVLDDNAIFRRLVVGFNPKGKRVTARVSHVQWTSAGVDGRNDLKRSMMMPNYEGNSITSSVYRVCRTNLKDAKGRPVTTNATLMTMEIGCSTAKVDFPLNRRDQPPQNDRFWLTEEPEAFHNGEHVFYMVFDRKPDEDLSSKRINAVFDRFRLAMRSAARFETGSKAVDQMLTTAPAVAKSLEVEIPGAFRAGPYYGVWAWDTFVHLDSMCLMGFPEDVRNSLKFFFDVRGEKGVPFCFSNDLRPSDRPARPEVQLFFVTLLNSYYQLTGDKKTLDEMMPTARKIVEDSKAFLREGDLLMRGNRFYPDQPRRLLMTDDDYALVINSLFYQGMRSWQELSGEGGEYCDRLRDEINRRFWDPKAKFYVDSCAADTFEQRPFYPSYGMFCVSKFGLDPLVAAGNLADTAEYMKSHFWAKYGLRTFELDTRGYQVDGGHCGACRPVATRNYWNIMNRAGRIDALQDFRDMVEENWKSFTYPEGQLLEFENDDLTGHNDCTGGKQFFSLKAWMWDVFELWLGMSVAKDGVSFHPMNDGKPFKAERIKLRGVYLQVKMSGRGTNASYVFNGQKLEKGFVPWSAFKSVNTLEIKLQ